MKIRVKHIEENKIWLEAKVLKQFLVSSFWFVANIFFFFLTFAQVLFMANMRNELHEMSFLCAANNRKIGEVTLFWTQYAIIVLNASLGRDAKWGF